MTLKPGISEAQRTILNGVFVVSTRKGGRVNAMTAAWVSRASFSPPLVTVSIGKTRFSHDMIRDSGVFAVNVLGPGDVETARHFGLKTGAKTDKFKDVAYETKATGSPVLLNALAWLDCRVVSSHDAGDHTLFVGEVLDGGVLKQGRPMVYERDKVFR